MRARLDAACERAGRPAGCVRLVGVTKSVDVRVAAALGELGLGELGESRAQVLQAKRSGWPAGQAEPRWHFIGHLQRNKVRSVLRLADELHSLDSPRLLEAIAGVATEENLQPAVWIELDLVGDRVRTGLGRAQLPGLLEMARGLGSVRLQGLMTMAPAPAEDARDASRAREVFDELRAIGAGLDPLDFAEGRVRYSMGMSSDFEAAVEAGSDLVRVGSALFEGLQLARDAAGGAT